jgi:hypothetical protein
MCVFLFCPLFPSRLMRGRGSSASPERHGSVREAHTQSAYCYDIGALAQHLPDGGNRGGGGWGGQASEMQNACYPAACCCCTALSR